ncbi:hypothetical protein ACSVDE_16815 [Pseudalkalibacillus sp. Hm43]|uniref:hypothetical protein n=1 Tax=Pseudalkalibacillus sp. Hm43 TaxID=3450742 RepID=UPI003F4227C1
MLWFLGEYTAIYLLLVLILVPVLALKIFNIYAKGIISAYYIILSVVFIWGREAIKDQYHTTPVPDIYWDKNTEWVEQLSYFYFIPTAALVTYIFYKWFYYGKGFWSRLLSIITLLIVLVLFLYFAMIFGLGFGYRP